MRSLTEATTFAPNVMECYIQVMLHSFNGISRSDKVSMVFSRYNDLLMLWDQFSQKPIGMPCSRCLRAPAMQANDVVSLDQKKHGTCRWGRVWGTSLATWAGRGEYHFRSPIVHMAFSITTFSTLNLIWSWTSIGVSLLANANPNCCFNFLSDDTHGTSVAPFRGCLVHSSPPKSSLI
jgi:hypothetical protein